MTTRRAAPRRSTRSRRPRGRTSWTTATLNEFNTAAGGQTAFDALGGFTQAEKHSLAKVLRVHLEFHYHSTVDSSSSFGRFGLIVENDDAIAAGAHLDPILDSDANWLVNHDFEHLSSGVGVPQRNISLDVKAQRLIPLKRSLEFILDVSASSNATLNWAVAMRILLEWR